jgi:hypothetical protein
MDGQAVIGIGLTNKNIKKLKSEPLSLTGEQLKLGMPLNILVFWGQSNSEMEKDAHQKIEEGGGNHVDIEETD